MFSQNLWEQWIPISIRHQFSTSSTFRPTNIHLETWLEKCLISMEIFNQRSRYTNLQVNAFIKYGKNKNNGHLAVPRWAEP